MKTELEFIKQYTKVDVSECSCSKCSDMCKKQVCIGTPEDIASLIVAGHIDKISSTLWAAGIIYGTNRLIDMYQLTYDHEKGSCIMLENNLCKLHEAGLKPKEGMFADCKIPHYTKEQTPPVLVIAHTWLAERNKRIVADIEKIMFCFDMDLDYSSEMADLKISLSLLKGKIEHAN